MYTLNLTCEEFFEFRLSLRMRFEVVWKRYREMCSLRDYTDEATIQTFRDDVLFVVSIIRKSDKAFLNHTI